MSPKELTEHNRQTQELTARMQIEVLRSGIRRALDEIGVPQPGYPAPVANAHRILTEALVYSNASSNAAKNADTT